MFRLIKWVIKTILVLTGILPFSRCSSGYKDHDGKVAFDGREITDKNFIILSDEFAKDSTTVYYKESSITDADVATFQAIDANYSKDKNHVYFCDYYREGQNYYLTKKNVIKKVAEALPTSFVGLEWGYAKDSKQAFFQGMPFKVKDVESLKSLTTYLVKDDVQAYYSCKPVVGSDGKSFELINNAYAKDKNHIYLYGNVNEIISTPIILPCDIATFEALEYPYSKDKASVFYADKKLIGMDAATFELLGSSYSKSKEVVYFTNLKIVGADVASFNIFKENEEFIQDIEYAKDKNSIFCADKKLSQANVSTFKVLGQNYGSDNQHVFYKTKIVKGAEPNSFKVYPHDVGNADSDDVKNKYHQGIKVK